MPKATTNSINASTWRTDGMDDEFEIEVQDFAIDEIRELLAGQGADLSAGQATELVQFIAQAGSVEDAQELLRQLTNQCRAA